MKSLPNVHAIILCAGMGSRAQLGYNKVLHSIGALSVAATTAKKFDGYKLVVVCSPSDEDELRAQIGDSAIYVHGGNTRSDSVRNGLAAIDSADIVLIHDGARPFVSRKIIDAAIDSAIKYGSGVAAVKSTNALRKVTTDGSVAIDRECVYAVQTPQAFAFDKIVDAYAKISGSYADDSEVYEKAGYSVRIVDGEAANIKLTTPSDFMGLNGGYKIGYGYDVHRLVEGRALILGGERIDYKLGLLGHSDADVVVHAVMDALLSACALPDIGVLFPDNDDRFLGADSMKLLAAVMDKIADYEVVNLSVCVMAQQPKLAKVIPYMRANLAAAIGIDYDNVNISATTTEGLGVVGKGEGIASSAMVLVRRG